MQFSKIIALAAGASAATVQVRGDSGSSPSCNSIAVCKVGDKYSYCSKPSTCTAQSGSPYCCTTTGVINILTCDNILDGNTISLNVSDILGTL